jgi:hypothetical protein
MAIVQSMCGSFKEELFGGIHDLDTDQLKMALFLDSASLSSSTTVYTTSGETSGTNYTAGGANITNVVISLTGNTAFVDFDNVIFSNVSLTARGALIYNSSKSNRAIAVLDFGEDKTSTTGDFEVQLPVGDATSAIIRIV